MRYDEDLDHLLDIKEFGSFLNLFIPYLKDKEKNEILLKKCKKEYDKIIHQEIEDLLTIGKTEDQITQIMIERRMNPLVEEDRLDLAVQRTLK